MHSGDTQARPNWRAIVTFYVLACALSWPFFWWRDVHTASWKAFPLPEEIKDLTWGPAVAALLVFWIAPATRRWAVSFFGPSWHRSAVFFAAPILFAFIGYRIHSGAFSYKLLYYLMIGGVSTLGEELGWRGFLQGSLRPLGRVRGYLSFAQAASWKMNTANPRTLRKLPKMKWIARYAPLRNGSSTSSPKPALWSASGSS